MLLLAIYYSLSDGRLQTVIHKKPAAGVVTQYVCAIVFANNVHCCTGAVSYTHLLLTGEVWQFET